MLAPQLEPTPGAPRVLAEAEIPPIPPPRNSIEIAMESSTSAPGDRRTAALTRLGSAPATNRMKST